jgi:hypothetical protein
VQKQFQRKNNHVKNEKRKCIRVCCDSYVSYIYNSLTQHHHHHQYNISIIIIILIHMIDWYHQYRYYTNYFQYDNKILLQYVPFHLIYSGSGVQILHLGSSKKTKAVVHGFIWLSFGDGRDDNMIGYSSVNELPWMLPRRIVHRYENIIRIEQTIILTSGYHQSRESTEYTKWYWIILYIHRWIRNSIAWCCITNWSQHSQY